MDLPNGFQDKMAFSHRKYGRFTNNIKVLQQELKSIKSQPLEGFIIEGSVTLIDGNITELLK